MTAILLLGAIAAASFTAAIFFLRFWRDTGDLLFVAFAIFFIVEGINRIVLSYMPHPNEGGPGIYIARLVALVLLLGSIARKNYGAGAR